jgi:uncharacterized membrane protein YciS (DUF1049 family)
MEPIFIIVAVVAIVIVAFTLGAKRSRTVKTFPYVKRQTLFTPAERSFLGVLEQAVGSEYRVFGKVRLADVIEVRRGLSKSERQSARNRIDRKHLDFLLCDPHGLTPVCAIELDDRSHSRADRQERDRFLEHALEAAGMPIARFPAKQSYTLQEVRAALSSALEIAVGADYAQASTTDPVSSEARQCPKCGAEMIKRTANRGAKAGASFWGCSTFPACRAVLPVEYT